MHLMAQLTCADILAGRAPKDDLVTLKAMVSELVAALHEVIRLHGSFVLRVAPDDVTCDGVSLYPARSRDDNLALPF